MKIADISDDFYQHLGSPSDLSIATIARWIRNNIGQLNSAINTVFYLNSSLEIVRINPDDPTKTEEIEIADEEKDVYKSIYEVYYFDKKIRDNILSYTSSPVIEVTEDGNTIRVASPTEIGRNLYTFRKAATDTLQNAINAYKINKSKPRQIAGDDTVPGCTDGTTIFRRLDNFDF